MPSNKVRNGLYWSDRTKTWHYEFRFKGKKRNGNTGVPTHRETAIKWLQNLKLQLAAAEVGLELPCETLTLRKLLELWKDAEKGNLTEKHIGDREEILLLHFSKDLDNALAALDTSRMDVIRSEYLLGTWRGKGWGRKTESRPRTKGGWNRVLRQVKALFRWGIERKLIKQIPFTNKSSKAQETTKPIVWPEDVNKFMLHLYDVIESQHVRSACLLMLQLGLREDEARNARWEWFISRLNVYRPEETKDRQVREIHLPPGLLDYLQQHHGHKKRGLLFPQKGEDDIPHVGAFTARAIRQAGEKMGIKGLSPHRLRATFATSHWEAGTDLNKIQEMMGHEDRETTMTYIVMRQRDKEEDQAKVAKAMGMESGPPQVPDKKERSSTKRRNNKVID